MAFHEIRFPASLSFGSLGGPERRTEIVTLANGFEERNTPWAHSRRRYDAGMGMRSLDDMELLVAFFEARQGQMFGFRWKDWADYKSSAASSDVHFEDQVIATGDGETSSFQLIKSYRSGDESYARPITKPISGTVRVGVAGDEMFEGTHFTLNSETGVIQFSELPEAGEIITAGYEFDVPVRFDTDAIRTSVASFQAGEVPNVPVVEIRV